MAWLSPVTVFSLLDELIDHLGLPNAARLPGSAVPAPPPPSSRAADDASSVASSITSRLRGGRSAAGSDAVVRAARSRGEDIALTRLRFHNFLTTDKRELVAHVEQLAEKLEIHNHEAGADALRSCLTRVRVAGDEDERVWLSVSLVCELAGQPLTTPPQASVPAPSVLAQNGLSSQILEDIFGHGGAADELDAWRAERDESDDDDGWGEATGSEEDERHPQRSTVPPRLPTLDNRPTSNAVADVLHDDARSSSWEACVHASHVDARGVECVVPDAIHCTRALQPSTQFNEKKADHPAEGCTRGGAMSSAAVLDAVGRTAMRLPNSLLISAPSVTQIPPAVHLARTNGDAHAAAASLLDTQLGCVDPASAVWLYTLCAPLVKSLSAADTAPASSLVTWLLSVAHSVRCQARSAPAYRTCPAANLSNMQAHATRRACALLTDLHWLEFMAQELLHPNAASTFDSTLWAAIPRLALPVGATWPQRMAFGFPLVNDVTRSFAQFVNDAATRLRAQFAALVHVHAQSADESGEPSDFALLLRLCAGMGPIHRCLQLLRTQMERACLPYHLLRVGLAESLTAAEAASLLSLVDACVAMVCSRTPVYLQGIDISGICRPVDFLVVQQLMHGLVLLHMWPRLAAATALNVCQLALSDALLQARLCDADALAFTCTASAAPQLAFSALFALLQVQLFAACMQPMLRHVQDFMQHASSAPASLRELPFIVQPLIEHLVYHFMCLIATLLAASPQQSRAFAAVANDTAAVQLRGAAGGLTAAWQASGAQERGSEGTAARRARGAPAIASPFQLLADDEEPMGDDVGDAEVDACTYSPLHLPPLCSALAAAAEVTPASSTRMLLQNASVLVQQVLDCTEYSDDVPVEMLQPVLAMTPAWMRIEDQRHKSSALMLLDVCRQYRILQSVDAYLLAQANSSAVQHRLQSTLLRRLQSTAFPSLAQTLLHGLHTRYDQRDWCATPSLRGVGMRSAQQQTEAGGRAFTQRALEDEDDAAVAVDAPARAPQRRHSMLHAAAAPPAAVPAAVQAMWVNHKLPAQVLKTGRHMVHASDAVQPQVAVEPPPVFSPARWRRKLEGAFASMGARTDASTGPAAVSSAATAPPGAKPMLGRGFVPMPGIKRSAWWDMDAQVEVKKEAKTLPVDGASSSVVEPEHALSTIKRKLLARAAAPLAVHNGSLPTLREEDEHEDAEADADVSMSNPTSTHAAAGALHVTETSARGALSARNSSADDAHTLLPTELDRTALHGGDERTQDARNEVTQEWNVAVGDTNSLASDTFATMIHGSDAVVKPAHQTPPDPAPVQGMAPGAEPSTMRSEGVHTATPVLRRLKQASAAPGSVHMLTPIIHASVVAAASASDMPVVLSSLRDMWQSLGLGTADEWLDICTLHARVDAGVGRVLPSVRVAHNTYESVRTIFQRTVLTILQQQQELVSRSVLTSIMDELCLTQHLWSLRAVFLFEQASVLSLFCDKVFDALRTPDEARLVRSSFQLHTWLQAALSTPGPHLARKRLPAHESRKLGAALRLVDSHGYLRSHLEPSRYGVVFNGYTAESHAALLSSGVTLTYTLPPPLQLVLTDAAMARYNRLFGFLLRVKHAVAEMEHLSTLSRTWDEIVATLAKPWRRVYGRFELVMQQTSRMQMQRHHMLQFLHSVHSYLMSGVLTTPWAALIQRCTSANHIDDLIAAHHAYLAVLERVCLLTHEHAMLSNSLGRLIDKCTSFTEHATALYGSLLSACTDVSASVSELEAAQRYLGLPTDTPVAVIPATDETHAATLHPAVKSVLDAALLPVERQLPALQSLGRAFLAQVSSLVHMAQRLHDAASTHPLTHVASLLNFNGYYTRRTTSVQ